MKTDILNSKRFLSLFLALIMVLFYVPQTVFAGSSSIVLFDGTHIVDTDTTVSSVHLNGGTLIIEEGVTLTVTENFANNAGHIVNHGTITVLGAGHCFPSNHVYNTPVAGSSCEAMTCAICKRPGTHTMNSATGRCESCSEFVAEAKIGSIYYQDLWTATEDAESGDTVILLRSLAGVVYISISSDKKITLDLNGFDLLSQIVQNGSTTSAVYVNGELNLINSDTDNTSTVEGVQCAIDVFGKLIVGENIECTSAGTEMRINSGIVDLSKADCENWKVNANGIDLSVGENLLLPENWRLIQDGTVVQTVSNGETATIALPVQSYNLWVGGVEVTPSKTSGEGWSYDQATDTLTLNGASITGGSYADAIIYTKDALNIVLDGNNTLSGSNFGIYAESSVNISGDGHLTAVGHWDGIQAHGNVTVNSGSITFKGESSYGIKAEGNTLTVNGGYVTADGGINGSGINASTVVLGSSSHLVVTHKSSAVWGVINAADGLCRTSADGDFSNTIAASGTYLEYMGSDHVTYTYKDAQEHTISCVHGISCNENHTFTNDNNCLTADVCSICGRDVTDAKSAHTYDNDHDTTCNVDGCTAGSRDEIHTWATTLTKDDSGHWYACSGCDDKKDYASHSGTADADCTTATACVCGHVITPAKAAHTYDNDHDTTCNVDGCTAGSRDEIHVYGTDWKSDKDNHWHQCSCGDKKDTAAHAPKVVNAKEATTSEKGYTGDTVCEVCGYEITKGEDIPVKGTSPATGDNSNIFLWIALLLISGGAMITLTVVDRRRTANY